jgi:hypothetical protein
MLLSNANSSMSSRDYGFIAPCVPAGVCTQENGNAYSGFTEDHHTTEASLRISHCTPLSNITNTLASGKTLFYTILVSCFYPMLLTPCHHGIMASLLHVFLQGYVPRKLEMHILASSRIITHHATSQLCTAKTTL